MSFPGDSAVTVFYCHISIHVNVGQVLMGPDTDRKDSAALLSQRPPVIQVLSNHPFLNEDFVT